MDRASSASHPERPNPTIHGALSDRPACVRRIAVLSAQHPSARGKYMMQYLNSHLLSLILFLPALGGAALLLIPGGQLKLLRWSALGVTLVPFVFSVYLWSRFSPDAVGFQFEEKYAWYAAVGSSLHLGVDGLSLTMVLLTTLLTPLAILASFNVSDRLKLYLALFLFLETGMLGVFLAEDLLIFFVFWEIGLVPMYFLINQWGSANRDYAS